MVLLSSTCTIYNHRQDIGVKHIGDTVLETWKRNIFIVVISCIAPYTCHASDLDTSSLVNTCKKETYQKLVRQNNVASALLLRLSAETPSECVRLISEQKRKSLIDSRKYEAVQQQDSDYRTTLGSDLEDKSMSLSEYGSIGEVNTATFATQKRNRTEIHHVKGYRVLSGTDLP